MTAKELIHCLQQLSEEEQHQDVLYYSYSEQKWFKANYSCSSELLRGHEGLEDGNYIVLS